MRKVKLRSSQDTKKNIVGKTLYYFALLLFIGVIIYVLFFSGLLAISSIYVSGSENISSEDVISDISYSLEGNYLSLVSKNNLILVKEAAIEKRLRDKFKKIENIEISRKFPSTLDVKIQERKSAIILKSSDRYMIVDAKGQAFEEITVDSSDYQNTDWPILKDASDSEIDIGDYALSSDFVGFVSLVNNELKNRLNIDAEREIETPNKMSYEIRLRTKEGWLIYLNANIDLDKQMETLKAVLNGKVDPASRVNLEYIDLRSDNKAFYKFKEGTQEEINNEEQKKAEDQPKTEDKKDKKKKK